MYRITDNFVTGTWKNPDLACIGIYDENGRFYRKFYNNLVNILGLIPIIGSFVSIPRFVSSLMHMSYHSLALVGNACDSKKLRHLESISNASHNVIKSMKELIPFINTYYLSAELEHQNDCISSLMSREEEAITNRVTICLISNKIIKIITVTKNYFEQFAKDQHFKCLSLSNIAQLAQKIVERPLAMLMCLRHRQLDIPKPLRKKILDFIRVDYSNET